ncbi:netrin receptor unc-5-like [Armigeres subalbatus]|uniref:netrin receptor unc-5-like n=1 Tax=Armigeres subalbatus TaxID=124917 RepID=UPI002ED41578
MKVSYKLSHFLNLYFIFATATTLSTSAAKQPLTTANGTGIDGAEQHPLAAPSMGMGGGLTAGRGGSSSPPLPPVLAASLTVRDKSGLEREPKPVNHHFSSSSSILSNAKGSSPSSSGGVGEPSSGRSRSKVNFNILYESSGRARQSDVDEPSEEAEGAASSGVNRNNEPVLSVSRQQQSVVDEEDEYDYGDGRGDNYEDDKIINPATVDNFFDKNWDGGGRFGHTATTKSDYDVDDDDVDEDSDEGDDIDEDSYGEGGDILPVDGAFASFGKTGEETEVKSDSTLPYFLVEPQSTHVIRSKPATLKCKAANALQVHFKCSGSNKPPPSVEESHVDPHSGVHYQEVTATVSRDLVYEYFGKPPFKCECHAWSPRGKTISQPASIVVAYLKKNFILPSTKLRAEAGTKLEIKCAAPKGYPKPQITWLKNNFTLSSSPLLSFSSDGNILISAVKLQDIGNYTCVAENIAGKRTSEAIELIVYVNGGWSQWSAWLECRCPGKPAQGRKRTRTCSDPIPLYGGSPCIGPNQQKTLDCDTCPEDTQIITPNGFEDNTFVRRWSSWSTWSVCSSKCVQVRRRICRTQNLDFYEKALVKHHQQLAALMDERVGVDQDDGGGGSSTSSGFGCPGKDIQSIVCRGGECKIDETASDWIFYLGLGFIVTLCITFFVFLVHIRHRQKIPTYSISRTAPDQHTYTHEFQKKLTHNSNIMPDINIRVNNYEYSNGSTMEAPKIPGQNVPLLLPRSVSTEHHYDEPQFASSYSRPIDGKNHEKANLYHQQQQQQKQPQQYQQKQHLYHQQQPAHHHPPAASPAPTATSSLKSSHQHQQQQQLQKQATLQSQPSAPPSQKSGGGGGQYMSTESLTSNTNTSISTYAVATTESLDTSSSNEAMFKSNSMRQVVTSDGGWLELDHLQTSLSIPEGALPETLKINVFLAVMYDSKDTILVENQITHISPTIVCGPAKSSFSKPLILKVPHCAEDISNWKISLFYKEEVTNCWKKIASSENDVPSPQAYIQLDLKNAYIMTRKLGKYILGGENLSPDVTVMKRLKIYMFGPSRKPETDFNIRVYILEDYPSALEHCSIIENRMGYFMIGQSSPFHFLNNKQNLVLRINCSGGWISKVDTATQRIPFNHVWKNMSILHCEFMLQKLLNEIPCLRVELAAEQENGSKVLITSVAFS